MEVSIATINNPLLSDGDVAVFAGDVDVKHTVLGGTLALNGVVGNGGREGYETITGHIRRDTLGLWSVCGVCVWVCECVGVCGGGWQFRHLHTVIYTYGMRKKSRLAYTENSFSSGQN